MIYTLAVSGDTMAGATARRAAGFARAALDAGHQVQQLFFFGDGIRSALDPDYSNLWRELSAQGVAELTLCSASADRLGITEAPSPFTIGGLGTFVDAGSQSHRILNFV